MLQFLLFMGGVTSNAVELRILLVVPAGIAGTQQPWMAGVDHIPVFWIPAIPAGMTA